MVYLRKEPYTPLQNGIEKKKSSVHRELIHFQKEIGKYISPGEPLSFPTTWGIRHSIDIESRIIPARPLCCETDQYLEAYAVLSLQRALLGRVTPELRAVFTQVIEGSVHVFIRFFYEGPISGDLMDTWELALSEVMADFGEGYSFDMAIKQLPCIQKIPFTGRYAYLKKGGQIWDS